MREIKFRCWEKPAKTMRYFGTPTYCSEYNLLAWNLDKESQEPDGGDYCNLVSMDIGNFEVMQFTGLLDKAGKEIYEGDIVRYKAPGEAERSYPVVYHHDGFVVGPDEYNDYLGLWSENVEVIGNIHENPELLK